MKKEVLADWFISMLLVTQFLLGALQLLDFLKIQIYPLIDGKKITQTFELGFNLAIPLVILGIIWVVFCFSKRFFWRLIAGLPLILTVYDLGLGLVLASLSMSITGFLFSENKTRFIDLFFLFLSLFNIMGVFHYGVLKVLGVSSLEKIALFQLNIYNVFGYLSPLLTLVFLFFWLLKPLLSFSGYKFSEMDVVERELDRFSITLLAFSMLIALSASVYPYFSTINPSGIDVGVDAPLYVRWFENGFESSRIFFFIIFAMFKFITGLEVVSAFRVMPSFLNSLFVLSSFYFGWICFKNSRVAAWCAFLSATGYVLTVGLFGFFLSNVFALSLVLWSLSLLFRAIQSRSLRLLCLSSLLGCLLVFTHPWTLDQYIAGLVPLACYYWYIKESGYRNNILFFVGYLLPIGLTEIVKTVMLKSIGVTTVTVTATSSFIGLSNFWSDSIFSFRYLYGGFMSNVVLLSLAIIGVYSLSGQKMSDQYLYLLVLLSSFVFLFSNDMYKTRLLLNLPLGLFGSVTLNSLYEKKKFSSLLFLLTSSLFYLFVSIGNLVGVS